VSDRVNPSFVIFDIRALWRSVQAVLVWQPSNLWPVRIKGLTPVSDFRTRYAIDQLTVIMLLSILKMRVCCVLIESIYSIVTAHFEIASIRKLVNFYFATKASGSVKQTALLCVEQRDILFVLLTNVCLSAPAIKPFSFGPSCGTLWATKEKNR